MIGSYVARALNRRGLRGALAIAVTMLARLRGKPLKRVRFTEGLWVHEYPDGIIVDRRIDTGLSFATFDGQTRDFWEYLYQPGPGDVVLDIGAGIGSELHRFSRSVGPEGLVVAVEAHPETFRCLAMFCELNGLDNVQLHNVAIGEAPGTVTIEEAEDHVGSNVVAGRGMVQVEATTLDDLADQAGISRVDYLKMNIEGAERAAIRGMQTVIGRTGAVCISCHDFRADAGDGEVFRTKKEVAEFLARQGFRIVERPADDRPWIADQINAVGPGFLRY